MADDRRSRLPVPAADRSHHLPAVSPHRDGRLPVPGADRPETDRPETDRPETDRPETDRPETDRLPAPTPDHDSPLPAPTPDHDSPLPAPTPDHGSRDDGLPVLAHDRDGRLPVRMRAESPGRLARLRPSVPAAVWLLTAAFAALLFSYSVAAPTYRAPDEPAHVDMVLFAAGDEAWPFTGGLRISRQVAATFDIVRWDFEGRDDAPPLPGDAAPPRPQRPSFSAAGADVPSRFSNQMAQHPPLYYEVLAGALGAAETVAPGPWPFDRTVAFLRLVSAAFMVPLPLLAWATARRLGAEPAVAVAAAALPLAIPLLTHVGASVSNDTLLTLLIGVCTWLTARVLTGDRSLLTATTVGVAGGLALLTKGFALFVPPWLLAVYALAAWRAGGSRQRARMPGRRAAWRTSGRRAALATAGVGAGALALATAIGSAWWIRNLLVLGTVQPSFARPPPAGPGFTPAVGEWLATFATRMNARFWGAFGWAQVSLPEPVMWAATGVVGLGLLVALLRPPQVVRRGAAALLLPLAGTLGAVVYGAWTHYADTGAKALMNGRYLYPALVGVAVATVSGWGRLLGSRGRWLPLAMVPAAVGMQLLGLHTVLMRFWGTPGGDSLRESVAAMLAWSPWPPEVVVTVWVAAVCVVLALAAVLARDLRRWKEAGPGHRHAGQGHA